MNKKGGHSFLVNYCLVNSKFSVTTSGFKAARKVIGAEFDLMYRTNYVPVQQLTECNIISRFKL